MEWSNILWVWVRENASNWRAIGQSALEIYGSEGSIWGTSDMRKIWFPGQDDKLVENILRIERPVTNDNQDFSVSITFSPSKYGAQAGILLYQNDLNYVKFVMEGNKKGGIMLIVARQIDGQPEALNKIDISEVCTTVSRTLSFSLRTVTSSMVSVRCIASEQV